ncbi:MAG TPA: FUSC family protein [Paraburkholderia sp.]|uniref:FUSC family protein n=1 Tax=Paraburkholderia sp. TaxID=1926495 RepID=UPI002B64E951|nr:FUSC family protein [Paraburkholderia sp.]HTR05903.1 FUSC family protein [Paraburkholderia sp.]
MRDTLIVHTARDAVLALGREFAAWKPSTTRARFGIQAMISVGLSVALAHALKLPDVWWAAISGFAVMQANFASSAERALHRVLGTVLGAAAGVLLGPAFGQQPWLFVPLLGAITAITVFRANASRASYGWVLGGVTAVMVVYEAHELHTLGPTAQFAVLRVVDVSVGVGACVLVTGCFHVGGQRRRDPAPPPDATPAAPRAEPQPSLERMRRARAAMAAQAAVAVVIVASFAYVLKLQALPQALVTIIAVLILPSSQLMSSQEAIVEKMVHRMIGALLAGAVGIVLLPLVRGHEIAYLLALAAGVWAGCHVQTGQQGASYVGRQFTIAFLLVFVQDSSWSVDPRAAAVRFAGIAGGIFVLGCVMLVLRRLFRF